MTQAKQPTILVIVGITGDLAKRKLLPAIEQIAKAGELPEEFEVVGVSRREIKTAELLKGLPKEIGKLPFVAKHLQMHQMDLEAHKDYKALKKYLDKLSAKFSTPAQYLFYLSIPPQVSRTLITCMGEAGLGKGSRTKLLLEKPFGSDLASAKALVKQIQTHFDEEQVYRIDHYLAKEMAQNLLVFRAGNSLFKQTWNHQFIQRVEIIASESIGIEGRVGFYEQTGALRDIVQSHLLELAALILMELPESEKWEQIPKQRLAALRDLSVADGSRIIRGQYAGYKEEVKNPDTMTETFVSLKLESDDPRWSGVPILLMAGKALARKYTEVRILYRQEESREANQLTMRIQPKEGISFAIWSKQPGYGHDMQSVNLSFHYGGEKDSLPEAYERVFLDAIRSDRTLFTGSDEVLASWRILAPVQKAWQTADDLVIYKKGSTAESIVK